MYVCQNFSEPIKIACACARTQHSDGNVERRLRSIFWQSCALSCAQYKKSPLNFELIFKSFLEVFVHEIILFFHFLVVILIIYIQGNKKTEIRRNSRKNV